MITQVNLDTIDTRAGIWDVQLSAIDASQNIAVLL
jgi:hypothetical protein